MATAIRSRTFGSTGISVPTIGLGTWQIEVADRDTAVRAVAHAVEVGLTHIDTAEMYGLGVVEELVAEAIAGRRDSVFLVSKVLPRHASADHVARACERSLRRLRTDRLDSYLLHYPSDEHPLEETIGALEALVRSGKIRSWGVSNFDVADLERAVAIAGPRTIACNQVLYHLGARYVEGDLYDACRRHDIALVGYSPFGSGRFPSARSHGGRVLDKIGAAQGVTARQVALAFLTRLDGTFTIPKAVGLQHLDEIAGTGSVILSEDDLRAIDAAFPRRGERLGYL